MTPHVRVRHDALEIDGVPTFLFGGEVQYFRVRDPGFDAARTHALWARTLDRARALGTNLVATYVPWDYHEREPGEIDFTGPRDLGLFLRMAAERGMKLIVKPGPFILAEWPHGFGSYGAIPLWWKRAHRGELVRLRSGEIMRWHPVSPALGGFREAQPSYGSRAFLEATRRWFAAVAEVVRPLAGPGGPLVAIQLDNEVNLFWQDAYAIDYHPTSLAHYRALLRERYGTIGRLSKAYGRRYRDFEDVLPPARAGAGHGPAAAHRDWFDHQHRWCGRYIQEIRALWEELGFREPDVLFLTNDTFQSIPTRDLVLPNGPEKNRAGLHCLDSYPRCIPLPRRTIFDRPWEPDFNAKLLDRWNDLTLGPSRFSFGIEIQGGHWGFLIGGRLVEPHHVLPEATLQTLLRLVAHGMKGMSLYTLAGGINIDGTSYAFQAAIPLDGSEHPRAAVVGAVGRLLAESAPSLLASRAVESPVAVLASAALRGPGYGHTGEQRIFGDVLRGLFGWLACAGYTPQVEDLALASAEDLVRFRAVVFPASEHVSAEDEAKLAAYVERGGTLVRLLAPGPLFVHAEHAAPRGRRAAAKFAVGGAVGRFAVAVAGVPRVEPPAGAKTILHVEGEHAVLGYERAHGRGRAIFLATSPADAFESARYYREDDLALEARTLFARRLLGVPPLFLGGVHEEVHARVAPDGVYLFVFSSSEDPATAVVRPRALVPLGLAEGARCEVEDLLLGGARRAVSGAALVEEGLPVALGPWGATVLRVRNSA